ncbi:hypothetical protein [Actinokineospora bangkokensis]|uniref:hypothetical protein n=1 Tax=Actinokineospora bangkokensis TaxID=1193682 RepID=UPI0011774A03|nr:hypothetical protein [Actinokineospora bangkokensis]
MPGPTIHDHIRDHLDPSGHGLLPGGAQLPDTPATGIRWASGERESRPVLGSFGAGPDAEQLTGLVAGALVDDAGYAALYDALTEGSADPGLVGDLPREPVHELGRRLVTGARHRGPVRFGLGLLDRSDTDLLLMIGRHEEFTAAAAGTIAATHDDAEAALVRLADAVDGWGRIAVVERFERGAGPAVREWLLRGGYRNSVVDSYLAHRAAVVGDLAAVLSGRVDPAMLAAACEIVRAMVDAAPAAGLDEYDDAPRALSRLLDRLEDVPGTLEHLATLARLDEYLSDGGWRARYAEQWTIALHEAVVRRVRDLLARPDWRDLVRAGLADPATFHQAYQSARAVDVDTFPALLAHVRAGGDDWPLLMAAATPERLPRILALAQAVDLPERDLDTVVTALRGFPGQGTPLVLSSLDSPVARNRTMAVRTLTGWGPAAWAAEIQAALRRAIAVEPDAGLREVMEQLLTP